MLFSLFTTDSLGVASNAPSWSLAPFAALLVASIWSGSRRRTELRSLGVLLAWLLLPVGGLYLISLNRPLYTARYLAFVLPAYLLLLAVGVVAVGRRSRGGAVMLLAGLLAVSTWGLWYQASTPIKADFRGATRFVTNHWEVDDLVLFQIPYGRHSFDYYLRQQGVGAPDRQAVDLSQYKYTLFLPFLAKTSGVGYRWAEGLYTNGGMGSDEVDQRMAELVSGHDMVWLVATEVSLWDERGLMQAWLDEHGALVEEAQFGRVGVYRYELR
jgi:hypothetical protein